MTKPPISGRTIVAGVVGAPVDHSLSPLIHNAWLEAAGLDGVYVAFPAAADGFGRFVEGLRGGVVRGLNVTLPFKEEALAFVERIGGPVSERARAARAANVLVFEKDGTVSADNTDGLGMFAAFARQAPGLDLATQDVLVLGAGGATNGAVAALRAAGVRRVQVMNRTDAKAEALADSHGEGVEAVPVAEADRAFSANTVVINATSASLTGGALNYPLHRSPKHTVVMDMSYKPEALAFLDAAKAENLATIDGLDMLIGQAIPSFEAFYGQTPDPRVDVRSLCLAALRP